MLSSSHASVHPHDHSVSGHQLVSPVPRWESQLREVRCSWWPSELVGGGEDMHWESGMASSRPLTHSLCHHGLVTSSLRTSVFSSVKWDGVLTAALCFQGDKGSGPHRVS